MDTVEIKVEEGMLRGEKKGECMIFRGVPYAEPPINENRFRGPLHKKPWKGVREATAFSAKCPQADMSKDTFWGKEFYGDPNYPLPHDSEDCLYLNIWAPSKPGKYPVAFWVHGGAFDHGFGSEMAFDGEQYAAAGVILVTINYRVGVFGFYADESLRKENPNRSTGNYGIQDQIAALQWVFRNIHNFGGDESKITVMGQSAGAISVQTLISSPISSGLISKAIIQSGGGIDTEIVHTRTMKEAIATGDEIRKLCKVKSVSELRKVPAEKLVSILPDLYKDRQGLTFGPTIDDYILKSDLSSAVKNGTIANIPVMIGMTGNDITVEEGQSWRKSLIFGGIEKFAQERITKSDKPVYVYSFTKRLAGDEAGAFHSSELWYMFGTLYRSWRPKERRDYSISYTMIEDWTNFIKSANPDRLWHPYTEDEKFIRQFM